MEQNKTGEQKGNRHITDSSQLSEALSSLSDGQQEPRPCQRLEWLTCMSRYIIRISIMV